MRAKLNIINEFLAPKKLAIAGVSRNPEKFGHAVFMDLNKKGFEVYPVNPGAERISGKECYSDVSKLPQDVDRLLILTSKKQTMNTLKEAVAKGIRYIWIQQMSETKEALAYAAEQDINLVTRQCILMYTDPVTSIHKFHRTVSKIFGFYPKLD
jgi:uncharacterized protein